MLLLAFVLVFSHAVFSLPLDRRTFTSGDNLWIVDRSGIMTYSSKSRSVRNVKLNSYGINDSIIDVKEEDGILWVSDWNGLFRVDMSTITAEKIPFVSDNPARGKVAVDFDYVWIATGDSLWRYDKLGNEWLGLMLGEDKTDETRVITGLYSDGDRLFCAVQDGMITFSIFDEKWNFYPLGSGRLTKGAEFFTGSNVLYVFQGSDMFRFVIDNSSWEKVSFDDKIYEKKISGGNIYLLAGEKVIEYSENTSVYRVLDIPNLRGPSALSLRDTLLYVSTPENIVRYDVSSRSSDYIRHSADISKTAVSKTAVFGDQMIFMYSDFFAVYDTKNSLWETTSFSLLEGEKERVTWDEEGMAVRWNKDTRSELKGNAGVENLQVYSGYPVDTTSDTAFSKKDDYSSLLDTLSGDSIWVKMSYDTNRSEEMTFFWNFNNMQYPIDLTLHNTFKDDRYLDINFDNSRIGKVPEKGIYYRGNRNDILHSVRLGTNDYKTSGIRSLPEVKYEGGSFIAEGKNKLEERDRKVIRNETGGGYVVSRTKYAVLSYKEGIYRLNLPENAEIIPGSVVLEVDGEEVDSTDASVDNRNGFFNFRRRDLVEPSSVITVKYDIRTVPDNPLDGKFDDVEFIPENNFGRMGYSFLRVSPREWISPEVGYTYIDGENKTGVVSAQLPLEFRRPEFMLEFRPDISVNTSQNSSAGGFSMRSRFGRKLGLQAKGFLSHRNFESTSGITRGYGKINQEIDYTVSYDLKKEIPISFYQHNYRAADGEEDRYEFNAGLHFQNYPFLDFTVSRNSLDALFNDTLSADSLSEADSIVTDTVYQKKDKIRGRLYETSSAFGKNILGLNRLQYEFSYTLFGRNIFTLKSDERGKDGGIFFGRTVISPVDGISFIPQAVYRKTPGKEPHSEFEPRFEFQAVDVPPGIDLNAKYLWGFDKYVESDSSDLDMFRYVDLILKPGRWWDALAWMSPRFGLQQNIKCGYKTVSPAYKDIVLGTGSDGSQSSETFTKIAGIKIYPIQDILFMNENRWKTTNDSLSFYTFNDLNVWVGEKNDLWQTRWVFNNNLEKKTADHLLFTRYDKRWSGVIETKTGMNFDYDEKGGAPETKLYPKVELSISSKEFLFIKKLLNNQAFSIIWKKTGTRWHDYPGYEYSFYMQARFKPNILLEANNRLVFNNGGFDAYSGRFSLKANF